MNARDYSGPTPFTEVVADGLTDFVKVLLDAGANPNIPNQVALFVPVFTALMLWELWSWRLSPRMSDAELNLAKASAEMSALYWLFMCQVNNSQ